MDRQLGRLYYRTDTELSSDGYYGSEKLLRLEVRLPAMRQKATLVGSRCTDGRHLPVLDLDYAGQARSVVYGRTLLSILGSSC